MDYYQGVVVEYLRADRAMFVNTEYCIQISDALNPGPGEHWFCDAVACDFRARTVFLCEISFSASLGSMIRRLKAWRDNWDGVRAALRRDGRVPDTWAVRPWCFIPQREGPKDQLAKQCQAIQAVGAPAFVPKVLPLELVQPWRYRSWDRVRGEAPARPPAIPEVMWD